MINKDGIVGGAFVGIGAAIMSNNYHVKKELNYIEKSMKSLLNSEEQKNSGTV